MYTTGMLRQRGKDRGYQRTENPRRTMLEKARRKRMISGLCRREKSCAVLRGNTQTDPFWSWMSRVETEGKRRNICRVLIIVNPWG